MINTISETNIEVQPEYQKSKPGSHRLLPQAQSENEDSASRKLQNEIEIERCFLTFYTVTL